jgi:hypothetical protein
MTTAYEKSAHTYQDGANMYQRKETSANPVPRFPARREKWAFARHTKERQVHQQTSVTILLFSLELKLHELGPTICWNTHTALANCRQRVEAARDKYEVDGVARLPDIYMEEKLEAVKDEIRILGANAEIRKTSNLAYVAFFEMQYEQAVLGGNRNDVADLWAGCREENEADAYTLEFPVHAVISRKAG